MQVGIVSINYCVSHFHPIKLALIKKLVIASLQFSLTWYIVAPASMDSFKRVKIIHVSIVEDVVSPTTSIAIGSVCTGLRENKNRASKAG